MVRTVLQKYNDTTHGTTGGLLGNGLHDSRQHKTPGRFTQAQRWQMRHVLVPFDRPE
jgi:hypothetical protein